MLLILSNKLDLNQETRFTILVYSTGFRITLPALTLKWKRRDFFYKNSKPRPSSAHAQLRSKRKFQTHNMDQQGNPIAGGSGLNQQQIQQIQPAIQGNNDAANLARQIQANTNVTMKTEVVKLPDFYGDPAKDTITALEFMARIDECQITNEWNDITTFSYFRLALRGQADKWLSSVVRHLQLTPAQKTWTRIRPMFKTEFAAFSDDKLIIDGLAKLSHRPGENPRMFFSRLEELIFVLKENYASYRVKPDRPAQEAGGGYSDASLTKAINDNVDNFANFMFTQMFKAAAPENVHRLLSHKDQTRLTVEDAYKVYFTDHRMEMDKKSNTVNEQPI